MKFLKQSGKMFVFLSVIAVVFGFFGNLSFAAEPNSDITCNAKPLDGVCKEAGKECTPGAGYQKYGHCDKVDAPCCVPDANVPKSGSTPITTKTECEATKGSDGKNAYCITTVGQNCSTFSLDQIGTCADLGSGTACCAAKGTPVPGGSTSSTPSSSASSLQYAPLENLPGFEGESGDFATYFKNVYLLALWIVGISALFMLVVGGFLYLSSAGNTSTLGYAKKTIYGALIGLVIALISWLLLNTINADLTNLKLSGLSGAVGSGAGSGTGTPSAGTGPGGSSTTGTYTHDEAVAALRAAGIDVTSSSGRIGCSDVGCTTLEGIPKATIDNLIAIKKDCGCSFNVTGGTESGHASHGKGKPIVDVTQDATLGNFLYSKAGGTGSTTISKSPGYGISKMCVTTAWEKLNFGCGGYRETSPHFHLVF